MGTRNDAEQSLLFVESRRAIYLMDSLTTILLTIFFRGSILYSSVGHAGASAIKR